MKNLKLKLTTLVVLIGLYVNAATRYSVASGNWTSTSTWSATSGGAGGASVPIAGDLVIIEGSFEVTISYRCSLC